MSGWVSRVADRFGDYRAGVGAGAVFPAVVVLSVVVAAVVIVVLFCSVLFRSVIATTDRVPDDEAG